MTPKPRTLDSFFTDEDFAAQYCCYGDYCPHSDEDEHDKEAAERTRDKANAILREYIEKEGMKLKCHNNYNSWYQDQGQFWEAKNPSTHSGILLFVEELKR